MTEEDVLLALFKAETRPVSCYDNVTCTALHFFLLIFFLHHTSFYSYYCKTTFRVFQLLWSIIKIPKIWPSYQKWFFEFFLFFSHCQHKTVQNCSKTEPKKKKTNKKNPQNRHRFILTVSYKNSFFFSGAWKLCKHRHARDIISLSWYSRWQGHVKPNHPALTYGFFFLSFFLS